MDAATEADSLMAELVERFGALPDSVRNLFAIVELKQLCKRANIDRMDAGPKGMAIGFRDNSFANPERLVAWITGQAGKVQLRADHKLMLQQAMPKPDGRPKIAKALAQDLLALV